MSFNYCVYSSLSRLYGYEDSFLTDVAEKIESWLKSMKFLFIFSVTTNNLCKAILFLFWYTGMDANLRYCRPVDCACFFFLLIAVIASHVEEDLMRSAKEG